MMDLSYDLYRTNDLLSTHHYSVMKYDKVIIYVAVVHTCFSQHTCEISLKNDISMLYNALNIFYRLCFLLAKL